MADALHELRTTGEIHGSKQRAKHAQAVMAMLLALVKHDNYQETDLSWINEEEEPAMDETWKKYEEKIYNKGKDDGYNLGKDDGYNLGKDDGEETTRNNIALKMLQQNVDSQFIMQMTSISQDELAVLQQQIEH
jgi:flagellar biosynthesis/type III secretory pathway protein FliH